MDINSKATGKEIVFYDRSRQWQELVTHCKHLTQKDAKQRAAETKTQEANFWRKHVTPEHTPSPDMDEESLAKAMQAEMDQSFRGR